MTQILDVTFPFFALVLVGWVVARRGWLPLESIPALNLFVLYFALPCMLFRFAAATPIARLFDPAVFGLWLGCALAMVALAVVLTRRGAVGWNDAAFGALVAAFPNSGFMGVPLLVGLLGERAAAPAIVALAMDMVITSSLCIALSRLGAAGAHGADGAPVQRAEVGGSLRARVSGRQGEDGGRAEQRPPGQKGWHGPEGLEEMERERPQAYCAMNSSAVRRVLTASAPPTSWRVPPVAARTDTSSPRPPGCP